MMTVRLAAVTSDSDIETIERYMPGNYTAVKINGAIYIIGEDYAGWTMEHYVLPRLASGLHFATELKVGA